MISSAYYELQSVNHQKYRHRVTSHLSSSLTRTLGGTKKVEFLYLTL